ncbi:hypothetical protein L3X38_015891 [Prunus dulcis]|uniref:Uncharacterized protein n=1 Tax=Prunus dulcis TaxID=3755 RepID=A0AAD4Z9A0_PRUDU|nr:hypothetical protein L3X38_015891 [Prunus dulcis]
MGMSRKPDKQSNSFDANVNKNGSGRGSQRQSDSETQRSVVRKQVDPETTKYFSEIANLIESNGVDMEERLFLRGCDVNSLCSFLRSCAKDFPSIAMDRSGSHVAETAIKSLSQHLQDNDVYSVIEDTLNAICKVIVKNPGDLMCDCYGSHVLRSLLSLFKGVPLDSSEFNRRKSSSVLAERLNFKAFRADTDISPQAVQGFPGLLDFLVSGMSKCIQNNIKTMQVDQYSSLVLQSALKLFSRR